MEKENEDEKNEDEKEKEDAKEEEEEYGVEKEERTETDGGGERGRTGDPEWITGRRKRGGWYFANDHTVTVVSEIGLAATESKPHRHWCPWLHVRFPVETIDNELGVDHAALFSRRSLSTPAHVKRLGNEKGEQV